ncbi:MAG: metallophosphoesterase family protein [Pseudohongiellaceae bacterium]
MSDIHVDYPQNLEWVLGLDCHEYQADVLLLAGDVSEDMKLLERVLRGCLERFAKVMFVPGNHDLWVRRCTYDCSLAKFGGILELCGELGVATEPFEYAGVEFLPLFSWYDFSFGSMERSLRLGWRDFYACSWPESFPDSHAVTRYFHQLNNGVFEWIKARSAHRGHEYHGLASIPRITCSHFLPAIELMPSWVPESKRTVYPVLGSVELGAQVRRLAPDIHVYGHSHVNQIIKIDSTHYVNNAFATPRETRIAAKQLRCIYDSQDSKTLSRLSAMAKSGGLWS